MSRSARKLLFVLVSVAATTVALASPALADDPVTVSAPTNATVGGSYTPVVSGGADGTAGTFTVSTPTVCSVGSDNVSVHFDHVGDCTVDGQKDTETGSVTFPVGMGSQTIVVDTGLVDGNRGDTPTLSAHTDSGLPVTFTVIAPTDNVGTADQACSITATTLGAPSAPDTATVSYDHAGLCYIEISQGGNTDYAPAETMYSSTQIAKTDQTITVPSSLPLEVALHSSFHVDFPDASIYASSGLPIQATVDASTANNGLGLACSITYTGDQFTINADHQGSCVIDFDQDGTDRPVNDGPDPSALTDYSPAVQVQYTFFVDDADQTVDLSTITDNPTVGSTYDLPTSTVELPGTKNLTLQTFSGACSIDSAKDTITLLHTGSCQLSASASGNDDYNSLSQQLPEITVEKGPSSVAVSTTSETISATVRQTNGSGADLTPGQVTFTVDGQKVAQTIDISNEGHATLLYSVPTGKPHTIAASYTGSNDLTGSTSSYTRTDPKVSVALTSSVAKSKYGWYRKPVTATFTCRPGSAAVTSCSKTVTLIAAGNQRPVTGTATTADGGASSVTAKVNIDSTAPTVKVTGPANGAVYVGTAPRAKCAAGDALSHLAGPCTLQLLPRANGVFTFVATAVDRAGNSTRVTGSYRLQNRYLRDSFFDTSTNSYIVQAGKSYTLVALAPTRPQYLLPAPLDQTPHVAGHTFYHDGRQANSPRWMLTVTLPAALRSRQFWNLGVKVGHTVYKVRIRVTG